MSKPSLLASTALAGLLVAPAFAADQRLPVKAVPVPVPQGVSWAGPYLGLSLGYAWAHEPSVDCSFSGVSPCDVVTYPAPRADGPLGTGHAGFNWQAGAFVLGVEADIGALYSQGVAHFPGVDPSKGPDSLSTGYDWLGTARARAGYATGAHLFYVTGGYAVGRVNHEYLYAIGHFNSQRFNTAQTRSGWTAGLGWELALNRHLSFKAEYLHVHLASSGLDISGLSFNPVSPGPPPPHSTVLNFSNNLNILRAGMNIRF